MSLYSSVWAEEAYKNGRRTSLPAALLHGIASLFKMLVLRLGFLDGWMGVYLSCMSVFYTMTKYLKLYERQKKEGKT